MNIKQIIAGLLVMSIISGCISMGQIPQGEKLKKIKKMENYKENKFENIEKTNLDFNWKMMGIIWEFAFAHKKARKPYGRIPWQRIQKEDMQINSDDDISFFWLGHSSILLIVNGKKILIDPMLTSRASPVAFVGPKRFFESPLKIEDFPELDLILISHDHYDHLDRESVLGLEKKTKLFIVPIGVGSHLTYWGIDDNKIIELNWWEDLTIDEELEIICTPAKHFSGRGIKDRNKTLWSSFVIKSKEQKIYFGGDSGFFKKYNKIGENYGPFDLTILPIGAYHEMWSDLHMNPEEAIEAHLILKGKLFIPIHWGTFDLAIHPWGEPIIRLKKYAIIKGINYLIPVPGKKYRTSSLLLKKETASCD